MQTANVIVDIAGDNGNQVPKFGVSPAEIAVLIAIHGEAAVHDIEPAADVATVNIDGADVKWTNRVELDRLRRIYGNAKDGDDSPIVDRLFPGAGARVFQTVAELELPGEFFKATARASAPEAEVVEDPEPEGDAVAEEAAAAVTPPPKPDPLDHDGDGKKGGSKAAKKVAHKVEDDSALSPSAQRVRVAAGLPADEIGDMPDAPKTDDALFQ